MQVPFAVQLLGVVTTTFDHAIEGHHDPQVVHPIPFVADLQIEVPGYQFKTMSMVPNSPKMFYEIGGSKY